MTGVFTQSNHQLHTYAYLIDTNPRKRTDSQTENDNRQHDNIDSKYVFLYVYVCLSVWLYICPSWPKDIIVFSSEHIHMSKHIDLDLLIK